MLTSPVDECIVITTGEIVCLSTYVLRFGDVDNLQQIV